MRRDTVRHWGSAWREGILPEKAARRIGVNGRFLDRPVTGVERVGHELLLALERSSTECEIKPIRMSRGRGRLPSVVEALLGHAWEQTVLAARARSCLLLSFCNTGPLLHRQHVVFIHDLRFLTEHSGHSRLFARWYRTLIPALIGRARSIIVNSSHTANEIVDAGLTSPDRISIVSLGSDHLEGVLADEGIIDRLALRDQPFALMVGSNVPHKNHRVISQAMADSVDLPPVIVVGNARPVGASVTGSIDQPGLRYVGRVSDPELLALYKTALCILMPSTVEGFGLPVVEAMRAGCPVVSAPNGALSEVCGDAALTCHPEDRAAWRDAIQSLMTNGPLREDLIRRGIARTEHLTWDLAARRVLETLGAHA